MAPQSVASRCTSLILGINPDCELAVRDGDTTPGVVWGPPRSINAHIAVLPEQWHITIDDRNGDRLPETNTFTAFAAEWHGHSLPPIYLGGSFPLCSDRRLPRGCLHRCDEIQGIQCYSLIQLWLDFFKRKPGYVRRDWGSRRCLDWELHSIIEQFHATGPVRLQFDTSHNGSISHQVQQHPYDLCAAWKCEHAKTVVAE